jgi:hypothetical protein
MNPSSLFFLSMAALSSVLPAAESGPLATMSREQFIAKHGPRLPSPRQIKASDYLAGRSPSGAIAAAIAARASDDEALSVLLNGRDWVVTEAVVLPSNTELILDGCTLKLADGVFDNIVRLAWLRPDPANPNGPCLSREPVHDIRLVGRNGAVIEGAEHPFVDVNPKSGVKEPWLGDFFGWRTLAVLVSSVSRYEIAGLTIRRTHCWAISQEQSREAYLHDLRFETEVKNGDGIDFLNGCSMGWVENISGHTSDDTVACSALDNTIFLTNPRYIWPMEAMGYLAPGSPGMDTHDILVRNVTTTGKHHGIICLATSPSVYNITIDGFREASPSEREAVVKIYTGYGNGYKPGNLRNIAVTDVVSRGAKFAVMVKADVRDVSVAKVRQLREGAAVKSFVGQSERLEFADE